MTDDFDVTKNAIAFRLSRQLAIEYGHVAPTPDELAKMRADAVAAWERNRAAWDDLEAFRRLLADAAGDPKETPLASRLLAEHEAVEDDRGELTCRTCPCPDGEEGTEWPCPVVRSIADAAGLKDFLPEPFTPSRPYPEPPTIPDDGWVSTMAAARRARQASMEAFTAAAVANRGPIVYDAPNDG